MVLVRLLVVDDSRGSSGASLDLDGFLLLDVCFGRLFLGHGTAYTVKPLLFVVDIVALQGVALTMGRIQRTYTKNVLY